MLNHRIENRVDNANDILRVEKFSDFYGCTAKITVSTTGKANLEIKTGNGYLVHAKTYNSYRGAKIAMGMSSECWDRIA